MDSVMGKAMVRHGWVFGTSFVVLAMSFAVLVTAGPAWPQDATTGDGLRVEEAQGEPEGIDRARARAQEDVPSGPLAGEEAEGFDTEDPPDGDVNRLVINVPRCTVSENGASITIQDQDGTQGLLVDDPRNNPDSNVDIIARPNRIVVVATEPGEDLQAFFVNDGDEELIGPFTVVTSSGIRCGGEGNETVTSDENENGNENENEGDANDEGCPVPEEVNTTTGSGDEQSSVSDITGGSFRVTIDVDPTSQDPSLAGVSVFVRTEDDEPVTRIAKEGGGTETSIVNAGEDSFFLDILAANANYEITVEDCTGNTGNGDDDGDNDNDGDADNDGVIDDTIPNKNLPNTGGVMDESGTDMGAFAGSGALILFAALLVRIARFRRL